MDAYVKDTAGLEIVGYYHVNERANDTELPATARRIGDRILQRSPQAFAVLVMLHLLGGISKLLSDLLKAGKCTHIGMLRLGAN